VAQAVLEDNSEKLDERAALIAHHWEQAGENLQAAMWHARAAEWAGVRDPVEALKHWHQVRALLDAVPESDETVNLGLMARIQILSLGWRQGVPKAESDAIFSEGKILAEKSGNPYMEALLKFANLTVKGIAWGETEEALNRLPEVVGLAEQTGDEGLQLVVEAGLGFLLMIVGRLRESLEFADKAIARAPEDPKLGVQIAGFSPYIQSFAFRATCLYYMGRFQEAHEDLDRAAQLAQEHGDIEVLGWAKNTYSAIEFGTGKDIGALAYARQACEIAEKSGSAISRTSAYWGLGLGSAIRGEWQDAKDAFERSLSLMRKNRAALFTEPGNLTNLAWANLELGEIDRARERIEEALNLFRGRGIKSEEPHAFVIKARILLRSEGGKARGDIEAALATAESIVRETGGRLWAPRICEARAELAHLLGDDAGRARELRKALELYREMNAEGHIERIEKELGT
jgi:adenylate cyclase